MPRIANVRGREAARRCGWDLQIYRLVEEHGAPHQGPPREYHYAPGNYAVYFRDPGNLKLEAVHVP